MGRLFGTDGIRGVANTELTPRLAFDLARAAGEVLTPGSGSVLIGRDTRRSGPMLVAALTAGFAAVGVDTVDAGVLPTGGVSRLTRITDAAFGVVVSASHNPAPDNGIKLIGRTGNKLSDALEAEVEARYLAGEPHPAPTGGGVGDASLMDDPLGRYLDLLIGDRGQPLSGMSLVLDCAHGAAHVVGPRLFRSLGADIETYGAQPDGLNINEGWGATHPETVAPLVNGRVAFCFDGDADRLIAVDEDGIPANGDVIIAVLARHMKDAGLLAGNRVVTTVMANLGFHKAMEGLGIEVVETAVGDRYVLEAMEATGASLGGEQSGHIIFEDRLSGDGLITAMRLAEVMVETGLELRQLRTVMTEFPQILHNIVVTDRSRLADVTEIWEAVEEAQAELQGEGRILVRPSGTEPLVRVMVEAADLATAEAIGARIALVVSAALN